MVSLEDEFGDILGKARDGKYWSQGDLADAVSLTRADIQRMERYEEIPSDDLIYKLAEALNLHGPSLLDIVRKRFTPQAIREDPGAFDNVCLEVFMGMYPVKCYLVVCRETGCAAVVDTGANPDKIIQKAKELGVRPEKILLTHSHPDHAGGLDKLDRAFNCPTWIDAKEPVPSGSSDLRMLQDGEVLKLGQLKIQVIFTPGHTAGGVSYLINESIFSGDAIFSGSMGRANASWPGLFASVTQRLLRFPDHFRLFPGHGPATTVGEEKRHNPFFSGKVPG